MNFNRIREEALAILSQCGWPDPAVSYLLAVSGGPDSVCLLHLMHQLVSETPEEIRPSLMVLHFNHRLRGSDSDADEAFVKEQCRQLGLPFRSGRPDEMPGSVNASSETWARQVRHSFLRQELDFIPGSSWLVLGHHQDDQAETVLLNLVRGSGLRGLGGMREVDRRSRIVRPLLRSSREDIESWLNSRALEWRYDASNDTEDTPRNYLRRQIIPLLDRLSGPDAAARISRGARILQEDDLYLTQEAERMYGCLVNVIKSPLGTVLYKNFMITSINSLPAAIRRRVLIMILSGDEDSFVDITSEVVFRIEDALRNETPRQMQLPGKYCMVQTGDLCRVYNQELIDAYEGPLRISGRTVFLLRSEKLSDPDNAYGERHFTGAHTISGENGEPEKSFKYTNTENLSEDELKQYNNNLIIMDENELRSCLIRPRRAGDTILIAGKNSRFHKSLRKYLSELKIWPELRDKLAVIETGGEIVWIPGIWSRQPEASLSRHAENSNLTAVRFLG